MRAACCARQYYNDKYFVCGGFLSVFFLFPNFAVHSAPNARIVLYILKLSAPINIIHRSSFIIWILRAGDGHYVFMFLVFQEPEATQNEI